jgi:hypothetical protein
MCHLSRPEIRFSLSSGERVVSQTAMRHYADAAPAYLPLIVLSFYTPLADGQALAELRRFFR